MSNNFINAIRKNHALEHATIAMLIQKVGVSTRLMGRSTAGGFYIYGNVSTEAVSLAANEGLTRLRRGDHSLAVSPLCGTNLATSGILAGLASFMVMGRKNRSEDLSRILLASTIAVLLAQPLGRIIQKHITTSPNLDDIDIVEVTSKKRGRHISHKIKTVQGSY